ncbi:mucin-like glycoprotein, putative [Trypanosoma cruzi marinkellei]|uniref:Mucin-like glycoprotein, putative n=1 Tax=Trypanosoma cruzi marinkellei TaxID=85056 RepID=K2NJA7_TRYCR|nr:mucin-like glycoprotein, putative [Trypanosoma cruzi marinkellei]
MLGLLINMTCFLFALSDFLHSFLIGCVCFIVCGPAVCELCGLWLPLAMLCALLVRVSMLRPSLSLVVSFTSPLRVQISGLTPATLRRMMTTVTTATALRREVCALLCLALLCCFASMCVTAAAETGAVEKPERLHSGASAVNVSVEISCADSEKKLQWRFPGQTNWTKCALPQGANDYTVDGMSTGYYTVSEPEGYAVVGTPYDDVVVFDTIIEDPSHVSEFLCLSAEQMYSAAKCNESCTSSNSNKTAFTMEFPTNNESGVYKKWLEEKEKILLLRVAPKASVR